MEQPKVYTFVDRTAFPDSRIPIHFVPNAHRWYDRVTSQSKSCHDVFVIDGCLWTEANSLVLRTKLRTEQ